MLLRGFTDALMMRAQRGLGAQRRRRLYHHYDQLFTVHGVIAIFVAMPHWSPA
jgi:cytochrome o ubiquinol oxidase subunit 1